MSWWWWWAWTTSSREKWRNSAPPLRNGQKAHCAGRIRCRIPRAVPSAVRFSRRRAAYVRQIPALWDDARDVARRCGHDRHFVCPSYAVDVSLAEFGVSPAATIWNDAAMALIAAALLIFYLLSSQTEQIFLRARERMNLTAELNYHLRRVLAEMRGAAEVEDREERLQMMDQAIEQADRVLIDLVPTVSAERAPRLASLEPR